jgi:hypothetical protein
VNSFGLLLFLPELNSRRVQCISRNPYVCREDRDRVISAVPESANNSIFDGEGGREQGRFSRPAERIQTQALRSLWLRRENLQHYFALLRLLGEREAKPFVLLMIISCCSFQEQAERVDMTRRSNVNAMVTEVSCHAVVKELPHEDTTLHCCCDGLKQLHFFLIYLLLFLQSTQDT